MIYPSDKLPTHPSNMYLCLFGVWVLISLSFIITQYFVCLPYGGL